jgi:hypothetical protein
MSFTDPRPKAPRDANADAEAANESLKQQMMSFLHGKIEGLLQEAADQPDKKRFVIDKFTASGKTWFKDREELLNSIIAKIEAIQYDNDAQFEKDVVSELTNSILEYIRVSGYSTEEVFRNFRILRNEQNEEAPLDKNAITYSSRYENVVEVHITKGLTPDLFKEMMSNLLQTVQENEEIEIIRMKSWVVANKLNFFRKLGFDANEITDEKELKIIRENLDESMRDKANVPWAEAHMSRDEFLKRFSKP